MALLMEPSILFTPDEWNVEFSLLPDMGSSALIEIRTTACVIIQMEGMQT